MWGHTLSMVSMNAWASCPERFLTILTSLSSEKMVAIRATCSSTVRVLLITFSQLGVFDRSVVRQKYYLRIESQVQHRVDFLCAPGTHLSMAGSISRHASAPAGVPVDPVFSEGAEFHYLRGAFCLHPYEIGCGIHSRFPNHDLISEKLRTDSRSGDVWYQREAFLII